MAERFQPEGSGYDYGSARAAGLAPTKTGHWPSRVPGTGLILKGRKHPTFSETVKAEKARGYTVIKGKNGRYYSRKAMPEQEEGEAFREGFLE